MFRSSLDGLNDHKTSWNGISQKKTELKLTDLHNLLDMTNMSAAILEASGTFIW